MHHVAYDTANPRSALQRFSLLVAFLCFAAYVWYCLASSVSGPSNTSADLQYHLQAGILSPSHVRFSLVMSCSAGILKRRILADSSTRMVLQLLPDRTRVRTCLSCPLCNRVPSILLFATFQSGTLPLPGLPRSLGT